ncbi:hypothetical protein NXY56_003893 [Leishmania guyanensis]
MFRWTAGTKARADRASRQRGHPGGSARLLLARCRHLHPRPSDAATSSAAATALGVAVAAVSQSSAHSGTEQAHSSLTVVQSAPVVLDDEVADAAVVTEGVFCDAVIEGAAQTSVCSLSTTTGVSSPVLDAPVSEAVPAKDNECSNTLQDATAEVASSPCPAPFLSRRCSVVPPSPTRDVVVNHGSDPSERLSRTSSSLPFIVLLKKQQTPHPPSPPLSERSTLCYRALPPPPLQSSSHSSSAAETEPLVEALEVKAARRGACRRTLERSLLHHREWRQRHKRQRCGETPHDRSCGTNALVQSSEEEVADTYAKVQRQHQRQCIEKQAGGERWPSFSINDSSGSYLHQRDRITQREEQQPRPHSRLRVAEQSVDCIAVQLPLQRAKDAPAPTITHTTVASPSTHFGAQSSSSLTCAERRESQACFAQDDDHSLPADMAIEVASDTFRHDNNGGTLATRGDVRFSEGAGGRSLPIFDSSPGYPDGHVGTYTARETMLSWNTLPITSTFRLPQNSPKHELMPVFEDQSLGWFPQEQVQASQDVFEYANTAGGMGRVVRDDHSRYGVAPLVESGWSVVGPASAFAATPAGDGEAYLWMPESGPPSFTPWMQRDSDGGTYAGAYALPADRVVAPGGGLALDLGDTHAGFYGGTPKEPSWWPSSADADCRDAEGGHDWQLRVDRCPTSLACLSNVSALLGSRGISTEAPSLPGLFSSHAVPRELPPTPASPWTTAGEGEEEVSGRGRYGDRNFSGKGSSLCLLPRSFEGALGSNFGRGDGDVALCSTQAAAPSSHDCSYLPPPQAHTVPFFGLPTSPSVVSPFNNTTPAAAPAPPRASRLRQRHGGSAWGLRALNGTTERCRRFWERCRQSHLPN